MKDLGKVNLKKRRFGGRLSLGRQALQLDTLLKGQNQDSQADVRGKQVFAYSK